MTENVCRSMLIVVAAVGLAACDNPSSPVAPAGAHGTSHIAAARTVLTASISGPSFWGYNTTESWSIEASGGVPPYTYAWNVPVSTTTQGITVTERGCLPKNENVTFSATVKDAEGYQVNPTKIVTVGSCP